MLSYFKAHYNSASLDARCAPGNLPGLGSCEAWRFLYPLPGAERCSPIGGGPDRKLPRGLRSLTGCGVLCIPESGARRVFLPRSPGLWVSVATAGTRPGGGQPEWGRGAPGASAGALRCSLRWPPCSPSRCRPRCRGETRVKYAQGRPPCPAPGHTARATAGQLASSGPPPAPTAGFCVPDQFRFPCLQLVSLGSRLLRPGLLVSPGDLPTCSLPR